MNEHPVKIEDGIVPPHYGALITETPDFRNHALGAYVPVIAEALPKSFYPNIEGIPHWHQRKLGACVGHAAAKSQQISRFYDDGKIIPFSARFLYAYAKCKDGYRDEGTYPSLVAWVMKNVGIATEATCPNDTTLAHEVYVYDRKLENIPAEAIAEAAKHKISNYAFPKITEAEIKTAIQFAGENKGGVMMLLRLDKAWWTDKKGRSSWEKRDIVPLRAPTDKASWGGHEVYPYAFDEKDGRTIIWIFNSWSDDWADDGNNYLFLDEYLPYINEVITTVDLDPNYVPPDAWSYTWTKTLRKGMKGADVVALQTALRKLGFFKFPQITGHFAEITEQAVKDFQKAYASEILAPWGLTQPTGIVSTYTLRKLNSLFKKK